MEFLKNNARAIIIGIIALIIIIAIASSGSNNTNDQQENNEATTSDSQDESESENEEEEAADETEGNGEDQATIEVALPPTRTDSTVVEKEDELEIVAVEGDNLSVMSRKIVAAYVEKRDKDLVPGQLLFMETTLVNNVGARDLIVVGERLAISDEELASLLEQAESLSEQRIAAWTEYL